MIAMIDYLRRASEPSEIPNEDRPVLKERVPKPIRFGNSDPRAVSSEPLDN